MFTIGGKKCSLFRSTWFHLSIEGMCCLSSIYMYSLHEYACVPNGFMIIRVLQFMNYLTSLFANQIHCYTDNIYTSNTCTSWKSSFYIIYYAEKNKLWNSITRYHKVWGTKTKLVKSPSIAFLGFRKSSSLKYEWMNISLWKHMWWSLTSLLIHCVTSHIESQNESAEQYEWQ